MRQKSQQFLSTFLLTGIIFTFHPRRGPHFFQFTIDFSLPRGYNIPHNMIRGRSSMVEHQLPKLNTRVRFPSPAPRRGEPLWFAAFFCAKCGFTVRVAAPLREKSRSARLLGCKRPRLRLAVATNFSRLKGIVLWASILSLQPSGKLPLPSRESHFVGFAIFLARVCV